MPVVGGVCVPMAVTRGPEKSGREGATLRVSWRLAILLTRPSHIRERRRPRHRCALESERRSSGLRRDACGARAPPHQVPVDVSCWARATGQTPRSRLPGGRRFSGERVLCVALARSFVPHTLPKPRSVSDRGWSHQNARCPQRGFEVCAPRCKPALTGGSRSGIPQRRVSRRRPKPRCLVGFRPRSRSRSPLRTPALPRAPLAPGSGISRRSGLEVGRARLDMKGNVPSLCSDALGARCEAHSVAARSSRRLRSSPKPPPRGGPPECPRGARRERTRANAGTGVA